MAVKCEKCAHEHTDWVPKSRVDEIGLQRDAQKALAERAEAQLTEARKVDGAALTRERDEARTALAKFQEAAGNATAMAAAGIDAAHIDDVMLVYAAKAAADDKGVKPALKDWLGTDAAKASPLLAGLFGKPGAPAPKPGDPPNTAVGTKTPVAPGTVPTLTTAEVDQKIATIKAMTPEKQREALAAMRVEMAQRAAPPN